MTALHTIDTVVIGAGHAGLAVSRLLTAGRPRARRPRPRPSGRALADRTLGLAAPAHPQLDDPAPRVARRTGDPDAFLLVRGLRQPARAVRRLVRRTCRDR